MVKKTIVGLLLLGAFTLNGCLSYKAPGEERLEPMQQSYQGVLPCADCSGLETSLFLDENGSYLLREVYLEGKDGNSAFVETGLWARTADRLTLTNSRGEKRHFQPTEQGLVMLDQQGEPIQSNFSYLLAATGQALPTTPRPLTGMYRYMADAAVFEDCATGKRFPVRNTIALEQAYAAVRPGPGEPVFLMLEGHFSMQPSMEEGQVQKTLIVDANARFDAQQRCPAR